MAIWLRACALLSGTPLNLGSMKGASFLLYMGFACYGQKAVMPELELLSAFPGNAVGSVRK